MIPAKPPDGSEGTCKLEVTYQNSKGKTKIIPANGCIVKNDENLQSYIQDHINPSADKVQFKNAKYFSYTSDRELFKKLKKKCIFRAKISCYRYSKSKEKTRVIENPQFVTVDEGDEQHIFLLCDSKDFDNSTFLKDHCKRVRTHQSVDENKIFGLIEDQTGKLKFVPIQNIKASAKPGDTCTGPILLSLDDNSDKVVVGCYRIKEDGAISYSIFGENQVQGCSSANDIHPAITSSASKTSPSSNDKPSFNGILSRNDNPSSNCNLETTDNSDGSQSRRQMADDGEHDLTHTEEEETKEQRRRDVKRPREEQRRRDVKRPRGPFCTSRIPTSFQVNRGSQENYKKKLPPGFSGSSTPKRNMQGSGTTDQIKFPPGFSEDDDIRTDENFKKYRRYLLYLAKSLNDKWSIVGMKLGLESSDLDNIASNHRVEVKEQAYQMLVKWKTSCKGQPKVGILLDALNKADLKQLADNISAHLSSRDMTPKGIPVNQQLLHDITKDFTDDWKFIGRYLGLEDNKINEIKVNNCDNQYEQTSKMLSGWCEKEGRSATSDVLIRALQDAGNEGAVRKVQALAATQMSRHSSQLTD